MTWNFLCLRLQQSDRLGIAMSQWPVFLGCQNYICYFSVMWEKTHHTNLSLILGVHLEATDYFSVLQGNEMGLGIHEEANYIWLGIYLVEYLWGGYINIYQWHMIKHGNGLEMDHKVQLQILSECPMDPPVRASTMIFHNYLYISKANPWYNLKCLVRNYSNI